MVIPVNLVRTTYYLKREAQQRIRVLFVAQGV